MKLSEKILYCRKRAGWTQEELAERLGVSRQAISKWETGEAVPELGKLVLLAKAFGVTTDWLLSDEEPLRPEPEPSKPEAQPGETWLDALPRVLGTLIRRYGWLYGVYVAIGGGALTLFGLLWRAMTGTGIHSSSGQGTIMVDGVEYKIANYGVLEEMLAEPDPVTSLASGVGTGMIILGLLILVVGVCLAVYLKGNDQPE